jgi:hypothetical protein
VLPDCAGKSVAPQAVRSAEREGEHRRVIHHAGHEIAGELIDPWLDELRNLQHLVEMAFDHEVMQYEILNSGSGLSRLCPLPPFEFLGIQRRVTESSSRTAQLLDCSTSAEAVGFDSS